MSGKSVNWTKEQMQVIESRGTNLLVSAAAGSGKTAVLVERIIRMVTEGEQPLDIDKLLVMTFTNAAAAEMRDRIGAAIEEKLAADPGNEHLQVQAALVHHAQITTIDSFCLNIIRNHFNLLDLDPSFQIGDEGELMLMRQDVMQELLEDYYQNGGERFEQFVETYSTGKSDAGIEDYIMQVYTYSQSNPYPEQWIAACRAELGQEAGAAGSEHAAAGTQRLNGEEASADGSQDTPLWMQYLLTDVKKQAGELCFQMHDALETCRADECLCAYVPMFEQDIRFLTGLEAVGGYEELCQALAKVSWARLAAVRNKEVDPEQKAYVTGCRDRMKNAVGRMQELYCFAEPSEVMQDQQHTGEVIGVLLELAEEFARRFQEKKRERNLVDFNDLEHEALKVLIRLEDGKTVYTEAADELSAQFAEVLVDEYQDSNLVQEALLHAVSRERFGCHNVFMVGDVKQSIYKFRLARPELFLEKYHSYEPYETGTGLNRKIELHQNFRSRAQVLHGINEVFYRIMTEGLGSIRYTEDAALHPGAKFAEPEAADVWQTADGQQAADGRQTADRRRVAELPELLVMDTGKAALSQMEAEAADYTARELEAKLIVGRIREMTDPQTGLLVWDKKLHGTGGYRTAQYRDMVILLRSTTGWTETLLSVLMNEGIPAYAESRMGYFSTLEVETVLSLLAVIDNPMQDIPLAAVLRSPVVGMTDVELAEMTAYYRAAADKKQDRGIYGAVKLYLLRGQEAGEEQGDSRGAEGAEESGKLNAQILRKLRTFYGMLEEFRSQSTYLPIHELIYRVYERTGYYHYVTAMPAGETRKANLDLLVERAAAYEKTSYKGLFNFIRYMENLKKINTDFGEASTVGEEDNTVRIMSIHKSKGLEFPIVFLAGTGKKFNRQDAYSKMLIDPDLGIGTDYVDLEHRLKTTTLKKNVLRRKLELDNMGEELRVLYVAMTRAKEKLILTGTDRYLENNMEKYAHVPMVDGQIPCTILSSAGTYLDWLLMSLAGNTQTEPFERAGEGGGILVTEVPLSDMVGEELVRQVVTRETRDQLLNPNLDTLYDETYRQQLDHYLNGKYPHEADIRLHTKMSVSELKKQGQMTDEAESVCQTGPLGPDWEAKLEAMGQDKEAMRQGEEAEAGALRGTAFHRALELLPFDQMGSQEDIRRYLEKLVIQKRFQQAYLDRIDCGAIWTFLQSGLGQRMRKAQAEGRLHREQQFVMGIPAREMGAGDSDELVVIQGIIDAYMEEEGQLILIDYKTDQVRRPQTLIDHYKQQLDYYERALRQMTGKPVKEKMIYSLALQQEIIV
ncbi:MAG: helicase-exonuclease AddAB subunit AddA [Eubacteriales bacterium]|nr:helicase-exonuclease AddAB subunit AddA [Eubacteriales bacterium]